MGDLAVYALAKTGDRLVTTKSAIPSTCGFAAVGKPGEPVRLLPGTKLKFDKEIRHYHRFSRLRFGGYKLARFRQLSTEDSTSGCDALELPDGRLVMLSELAAGLTATVMQVPPVAAPTSLRRAAAANEQE